MNEDGPRASFARAIVARREALNLRKGELARRLEMSLGSLWKYEHGEVTPGRDMVRRFADALEVEPGELWPESAAPAEEAVA